MDLQAKDVIAVVALIGGFVLLAKGIDGMVGAVITLIAGYYFGSVERYTRAETSLGSK